MNQVKILLAVLSLLLLSGCAAPILLFGGAAGAGTTLAKDKTVGSSVDDTNIWAKIKAAFLQHHKEIEGVLSSVSVEVSEGRVLLIGTVASADDRLKILRLVWEQAGVREVINELKIHDEEGKSGLGQYSSDTWITTQVKSKMLMDKIIHSINYNIETMDGMVYALGVARDEVELERVRTVVESIAGINKFVSYVRVKGQKQVKAADTTQIDNHDDEEQVIEKSTHTEPGQKSESFIDDEVEYEKPIKVMPKKKVKKPIAEDDIEIEYSDSE
jgi:osmotically-inducible protein OsmY